MRGNMMNAADIEQNKVDCGIIPSYFGFYVIIHFFNTFYK